MSKAYVMAKEYSSLLPEIEGFKAKPGSIALWSIGGPGFVLKTARALIYIDPYFGGDAAPDWRRLIPVPIDVNAIRKVDLVVSTHEHGDHADPGTFKPIMKDTKAKVIGPSSSVDLLAGSGISKDKLVAVKAGESYQVGDVKVTAFEANDPGAKGALMFLYEAGAVNYFHAGDTLYTTKFAEYGAKNRIDIACLSLGRNPPQHEIYMNPCHVVQAAMSLNAKVTIPMHWDLWSFVREDPTLVHFMAEKWGYKGTVKIMKLGERLDYRGVS